MGRACAWIGVAVVTAVIAAACGTADDETGPVATGGTGVGAAGAGGAVASGGAGGGAAAAGGGGAAPWQPVETPWCTGDWLGLRDDVCFYVPAGTTPTSLLVFLHGMMPPDSLPKTMQAMVRTAADTHGFAALFPRGEQGLCSWDPSVQDWWCWPTSRPTVDARAAELCAGWDADADELASLLGTSFDERWVLGFSNGGYFASYVGLEDLWHSDGAGVVAAGRSYVDTSLLAAHRPPIYVAVGDLDTLSVQQSAENLAWVLYLAGWPYDYVLHPGRGHELGQDDFDAAWALFTAPP